MQIRNYTSSKPIVALAHFVFGFIYLLLILRAAVSHHQGPANIFTATHDSLIVLAIKRVAGLIYSPFWLMLGYPTVGGEVVTTILFALFGYAVLHCGMFVKLPADRSASMVNKILDFCRMLFFLAGTLLILLMVARMGVMLYQDLGFGRLVIGVPAKK
jgi:hypothetical protein